MNAVEIIVLCIILLICFIILLPFLLVSSALGGCLGSIPNCGWISWLSFTFGWMSDSWLNGTFGWESWASGSWVNGTFGWESWVKGGGW